MRNFLVSIEDKDFDKLKTTLEDLDAEFENDGQVIQEIFWIENNRSNGCDVRNNIKVSEMEKEYTFKEHLMKDLS